MPEWLDNLENEKFKTSPTLQRFNTLEDALNAHLELDSFRGNAVRIPSNEAGDGAWDDFASKLVEKGNGKLLVAPDPENDEQMAAFRKTIGVPEKMEDYVVEGGDEEAVTNIQKASHEMALTKDQHRKFLEFLENTAGQAEAAQKAQMERDRQLVLSRFGESTEGRTQRAAAALADMLPDDVAMPDHLPAWAVLALDSLLESSKEGGLPQAFQQAAGTKVGPTREELDQAINDIRDKMTDPEQLSRMDVQQRKAAAARLQALYEQRNKAG